MSLSVDVFGEGGTRCVTLSESVRIPQNVTAMYFIDKGASISRTRALYSVLSNPFTDTLPQRITLTHTHKAPFPFSHKISMRGRERHSNNVLKWFSLGFYAFLISPDCHLSNKAMGTCMQKAGSVSEGEPGTWGREKRLGFAPPPF